MKTMELKGQVIPQVSHTKLFMYFFNFMSKNWLKSDNSERLSEKEWKKSQFCDMTQAPHSTSQWFTELDSNPEREKLAKAGTEKGKTAQQKKTWQIRPMK